MKETTAILLTQFPWKVELKFQEALGIKEIDISN